MYLDGFYAELWVAVSLTALGSLISTACVAAIAIPLVLLRVLLGRRKGYARTKKLVINILLGAIAGSVFAGAAWSAWVLFLGYGLGRLAYQGQGFGYAMLLMYPIPIPMLPTAGAVLGSAIRVAIARSRS